MRVKDRNIGTAEAPFIIAELSANHGGSLERAKESIKQAAKAGVSAIKLQTYTPDTMTIDCNKPDFLISEGLWSGFQLYDLYKHAFTPFEWHFELFRYANEIGVTLFSTPFDESAVDLLEELGAPAYKIASFEIVDLQLLQYVAKKNKPIFLSTGMASLDEITEAMKAIRSVNDVEILLFHCISSYPASTDQANLSNILLLKEIFGVEVGLSDHTMSNVAAMVSIGMGAVAIEKHFKLDDEECGPDASFSLNIEQLSSLIHDCNEAWRAKGSKEFMRAPSEEKNLIFRRSLYFINDLQKGDIIGLNDIRRIRPGYGLSPKYLNQVIGKSLARNVERGTPVKWEYLE